MAETKTTLLDKKDVKKVWFNWMADLINTKHGTYAGTCISKSFMDS